MVLVGLQAFHELAGQPTHVPLQNCIQMQEIEQFHPQAANRHQMMNSLRYFADDALFLLLHERFLKRAGFFFAQ